MVELLQAELRVELPAELREELVISEDLEKNTKLLSHFNIS